MADDPERPDRLRVHYVKSADYRTVHSDGAYGGLTPTGGFSVTFYSQRFPIPTEVELEVDAASGRVGAEIAGSRLGRTGIVREMGVTVAMDVERARALSTWLSEKLAEVEELRKGKAGDTDAT